jgi:hypothetical protein
MLPKAVRSLTDLAPLRGAAVKKNGCLSIEPPNVSLANTLA